MNAQRWRHRAQHGVLESKGEVQLHLFHVPLLELFSFCLLVCLILYVSFCFIVVYLITKEESVALQNIESLFRYPNICQLGWCRWELIGQWLSDLLYVSDGMSRYDTIVQIRSVPGTPSWGHSLTFSNDFKENVCLKTQGSLYFLHWTLTMVTFVTKVIVGNSDPVLQERPSTANDTAVYVVSVAVSNEMLFVGPLVNARPQSNGQKPQKSWLLLAAASQGWNTRLDFNLSWFKPWSENKRIYGFPKRIWQTKPR